MPRLPELACGVDDHAHAFGFDAQFLHRDLKRDGVHALAHLGPAVAHLDRAVGLEAHDRAHDLEQAVAEAGVLEPEADADGATRGLRGLVRGLQRIEAAPGTAAAVVHDLAGTPHVARVHHRSTPDPPTTLVD